MTYSQLQIDIANWLNREDLESEIRSCIRLAEARLNRVLLCPEREAAVISTVISATFALPDDYCCIRAVHLHGNPLIPLQPMSLMQLRAAHRLAASGVPTNYAVVGGSTLVLNPVPDQEFTIELIYYQSIPALSDATPSNWLLAAHPDLYLSAALVEAFMLTMDEQRAAMWEARASSQIKETIEAGRAKSRGAAIGQLSSELPQLISSGRHFQIING